MRRLLLVLTPFATLVAAPALWAGGTLTPEQAARAVATQATVYGTVASIHVATRSRG